MSESQPATQPAKAPETPAGNHEAAALKIEKIGASVAGVIIFLMIVITALQRDKLYGFKVGNKAAAHMFEKIVLVGKGGLVALFLLLSFINGHVEYVSKNPKGFLSGSIAIALTSAAGGLLIAWNRKRPDLFFDTLFIGALFFFLFAVTREFSGYFALMSGEGLKGTEEKQRNIMTPILGVLGLAALIYMTYLAFMARVQTPEMIMPFPLEWIFFVFICSIGEVIVAKQHGEAIGPAIGSSILLFGGAHIVLQYGGFYRELYGHFPINMNILNDS